MARPMASAGKTTPKELVDELQVLCAFLTAPGYRPEAERGVRWNDPAFGIAWPDVGPLTLSTKDQAWPDYVK